MESYSGIVVSGVLEYSYQHGDTNKKKIIYMYVVSSSRHRIMTTHLLKRNWKVLLEGLSLGHPNKINLLLGEVWGQ